MDLDPDPEGQGSGGAPSLHTGSEVVNKFVCNYPGLKIVSKDLGRSSEKNLRKKDWGYSQTLELWSKRL